MRDHNEPELFGRAARASSATEDIAYLGDPNVVGALLRETVVSVMDVYARPNVSDADKMGKLQRECQKLGSILLGTLSKSDFSPIPGWNQPGGIDEFCAKWCGSSETSPRARMEHAALKMMTEVMELAKYAGRASEEESKWQLDAIIQSYTGIFMGISPAMQALG